jgi:hypothetical protein
MRQLAALLVATLGCSGTPATADGGNGGGSGGGTGGAGGGAVPCSCGGGQTCVEIEVTRAPDAGFQPWVAFPSQADGVGTLIGSVFILGATAFDPSILVARGTLPDADMKPSDARYVIDLGCIDAGTYRANAFLDDDMNALPDQIASVGYRDSCSHMSRGDVDVHGSTRVKIPIVLDATCD